MIHYLTSTHDPYLNSQCIKCNTLYETTTMYLMCLGPPSSDETTNHVYELRNDEGETSKGFLSMNKFGHHLWDDHIQCGS